MRQRLTAVFAILVATIGVMVAGGSSLQAQRGRDWALLGERTVTDRGDHDTIVATGVRGTFTAVKFEVQRHAVDFQRVVIHFGNGDDQKVELRDTIRAGGETRVIDIEGANRVIRSIDFWYDANTIGRGGRAVVRVLGRR